MTSWTSSCVHLSPILKLILDTNAAGHVTGALYAAATRASSGRDPFDPDAT